MNSSDTLEVVTTLAAALRLARQLGVNLQAVSQAIAQHPDGMSAEDLQAFVDDWRRADQIEADAYDARLG